MKIKQIKSVYNSTIKADIVEEAIKDSFYLRTYIYKETSDAKITSVETNIHTIGEETGFSPDVSIVDGNLVSVNFNRCIVESNFSRFSKNVDKLNKIIDLIKSRQVAEISKSNSSIGCIKEELINGAELRIKTFSFKNALVKENIFVLVHGNGCILHLVCKLGKENVVWSKPVPNQVDLEILLDKVFKDLEIVEVQVLNY